MPDQDSVLIATEGDITISGRVSPLGVASRGLVGGESETPIPPGISIVGDPAAIQREVLLVDALFEGGDFALTTSGDLALVEGLQNLRDAIGRRLITRSGQVVFRPEYGIGIIDFVARPNSERNKQDMINRVRANLMDDSRVEKILSLTATQQPGYVALDIVIKALGVPADFYFVAAKGGA